MRRKFVVYALIGLSTAALILGPALGLWAGAWNVLPALLLAALVIGAVVAEDHVMNLIAVLALVFGTLIATLASGVTPLLGLDLKGGFSVVLEAPEDTDPAVLDKAVEIMRDRIEALGNVQEPQIAVAGANSIVVQLPGVTDRERAIGAVGTTGALEFRPVLEISPVAGVSPLIINATITTVPATTTTLPADDGSTTTTVPDDGSTTTTVPGSTQIEITLPAGVTFCDPAVPVFDQPGCVDETTGVTLNSDSNLEAWLVNSETGLVYHLAPAEVLGSDVSGAEALFQQTGGGGAPLGVGGGGTGSWVVRLDFSGEGGDKFTETTKYLASFPIGDSRRQFAIVLDGDIQSAPQVAEDVSPEEGISGGTAIITLGSAEDQQTEANDLAVVLRYGALPVALDQATVQSVSATLGSDSLQAGLYAGIGGLLLVALAMIAYYRGLGLINVLGLTVFGSIMLVLYSLLGEMQGVTLTLAGVAGVIVSVGITSDSYIVYFERIKEEVHGGRSMRAAVGHGFQRAFRTILTADTVSFVGAALLFLLAVGSVKGFALALGLATVTDVLVAYFFTKPAVAIMSRSRMGDGGAMSIRGAMGRPKEVAS
ncbi:protein translocase subunit SecD [bacterium]|nr:protein translocase subunit SecD [bacterium]